MEGGLARRPMLGVCREGGCGSPAGRSARIRGWIVRDAPGRPSGVRSLPAPFPERERGVLSPLVAMTDDALGAALCDRHVQRCEHQLGSKMVGHGPPDHLAAEHIEHDGQEHESGPGRHVGDIGDPEAVRGVGAELAFDPVQSRSRCVVRVPRRRLTPANPDWHISRATRLRPARHPWRPRSACTRGTL